MIIGVLALIWGIGFEHCWIHRPFMTNRLGNYLMLFGLALLIFGAIIFIKYIWGIHPKVTHDNWSF